MKRTPTSKVTDCLTTRCALKPENALAMTIDGSGGRVGDCPRVPRCVSGKAQLLALDLEQCNEHMLAEVQ